ncbi:ARM repeat-containing protein [Mollisia scopiformis]|uniref:ARM repeat-containing protein n=1 Tax=Mollisia scopiformis TaxID=149040 RepID=A0A132BER1_MOLSC|nr:ARM repeat-containing protein [Mollisia scopiformis]KUJ10344.1 ARM repeat-containing protein [Mollisia scopiformis]
MVLMATNGSGPMGAFAPVLNAMSTMRDGQREQKKVAHQYLESFQKSAEAWQITIGILGSEADAEAKLFAATTLRGKITYDVGQIPADSLPVLRDQLLQNLKSFATGPKPIRIQLCVCLAILAIQMTEWKDVVPMIVSTMGNNAESHACILDFLRVLPEEVTEGRKINLTEDELQQRTQELLGDNAALVVQLLISYAQSSASASTNPQLLEVVTSWLREVPVADIVSSPLLNVVFNALDTETSFDAATDCLCAIFKETREVDEYLPTIQVLLPRVIALRPRIAQAQQSEDTDVFKGLTRIFAEAGEAWVVLIAREPAGFRPLVETVLECAARDIDKEAIALTFIFWYELKLYLILEKYIQARVEYVDIYSKLVDVMLKQLEYPTPEGNETDLFDGDREAEEKFREFRHHMGDVLKDCCEIMGVTECLTKVLEAIKAWMGKYAGQATAASVPYWQQLEAPLFSMRAMGRMVDKDEDIILPQIMPLLVQIPPHEKLRFATIMVLGRYTEWTSNHPEMLGPQFTYIASSFKTDSKEIVRAAAMSMKFFCTDCKHLLGDQVVQLQQFYNSTLDELPGISQEELTEGVASVVAVQPPDQIFDLLKLYCDPLMARLMALANQATDNDSKLAVADHLQLITFFVQIVTPYVEPGHQNPAVRYCQEIFPILATILENFIDFTPICERICRNWRYMIISYRVAMAPLLPQMANKLASGFATSKQGCFLWVTSAILREFSEDREHVDDQTTEAIYAFFESQATNMLRMMSDLPPQDLPDVIEDFYRLLVDALLYYPHKMIRSDLFTPIFQAAVSALALEQRDPLNATLHYIRDVIGYGGDNPPSSSNSPNPPEIKHAVQQLLLANGEMLVKQILAGMMITFPDDCFTDGSGALLGLFEIMPQQTGEWVDRTVRMLPAGTVNETEINRLMTGIRERLALGTDGMRKVRSLLQDFTNNYRRRYVAPRDGLGRLEAERFHFNA